MNALETGKLIQKKRTQKKMTQEELAELLCVSNKAVSKWECGGGYPDIELLPKISKILDIEINQLVTGNSLENKIISFINKPIKRIAVWGDSITKGVIQGNDKKKYEVSQDNSLSVAAKKLGFNLYNRSYLGSTTEKGKSVLQRDLDKEFSYDIAIIGFGGNDCDYNWAEISNNPDGNHLPKIPLEQFSKNLCEMIKRVKEKEIIPVVMNLIPLVPSRYFKTITQGLNAKNILKWLHDENFIYRWHEMYSNEIVKIAKEEDCILMDIRSEFLKLNDYEKLMCEDGIHPNEEGQKLIKKYLLSFYEKFDLPKKAKVK